MQAPAAWAQNMVNVPQFRPALFVMSLECIRGEAAASFGARAAVSRNWRRTITGAMRNFILVKKGFSSRVKHGLAGRQEEKIFNTTRRSRALSRGVNDRILYSL